MGNKYCYSMGHKQQHLLNNILNREYKHSRTLEDHAVAEYLEYIEGNPEKLQFAANYIYTEMMKRRDYIVKRGFVEAEFNLILNALQATFFILKDINQKEVAINSQNLPKQLNDVSKIKITMKPAFFMKKMKTDSIKVDRLLKFQLKSCRTFDKTLTSNYSIPSKHQSNIQHTALILCCWNEIFKSWSALDLSNYDESIVELFKKTLENGEKLIEYEEIQKIVAEIYANVPFLVYDKTKQQMQQLVSNCLASPSDEIRQTGVTALSKLLANFRVHHEEKKIADILQKYSVENPNVLTMLPTDDANDLEQPIFNILYEKVRQDKSQIAILIKFFNKSSPKMLNFTNLALLADFVVMIFEDPQMPFASKQELFNSVMNKCG